LILKKLLIGFVVVVVLIFGWVFFKPGMKELNAPTIEPTPQATEQSAVKETPSPEPEEPLNFTETGNLVFEGNSWYLLYEEPGAPALSLKLVITDQTKCNLGENVNCDLNRVKSGARVQVSGRKSDNTIEVNQLDLVSSED